MEHPVAPPRPSPGVMLAGGAVSLAPLTLGMAPFGPDSGLLVTAARLALLFVTGAQLAGAGLLALSDRRSARGVAAAPRLLAFVEAAALAAFAGGAILWLVVAATVAAGRALGAAPAEPYPLLLAGPLIGLSGSVLVLAAPRVAPATMAVLVGCGWVLVADLWPTLNGTSVATMAWQAVLLGVVPPWAVLLSLAPTALVAAAAAIALSGGRLRLGRVVGFLLLDVALLAALLMAGLSSMGGSAPPPVPPPHDPVALTWPEAFVGLAVGCAWAAAGMFGRATHPVRWGLVAVAANPLALFVLPVVALGSPAGGQVGFLLVVLAPVALLAAVWPAIPQRPWTSRAVAPDDL